MTPLHNPRGSVERLRSDIAGAIRRGKLRPGDRLAPIRTLAKRYKLAFGTTRNALETLERQGLITRRIGSGTYVRELRRRVQPTAAAHVVLLMDYQGHLFSRLAMRIVRDLQPQGWRCVPTYHGGDRRLVEELYRMIESWADDPPRAVVYASYDRLLEQEIDRFVPAATRRIRVMDQYDEPLRVGWHSVQPDLRRALELVVDHLIARGHRRIGYATHGRGIDPAQKTWTRKALHARGILMLGGLLEERGQGLSLTIYTTRAWPANPDGKTPSDPLAPHNLRRAEQWLRRQPRPSAVICQSDYRAVAIRAAAINLGLKLPDDLELIGFGHTPWSQAYNFSTISFSELEVGRQVAQLITADHAELGMSSRRIYVTPELIVRDGRSDATPIPDQVPDFI